MLLTIISFGIYTYFFINLGNTCFRRDTNNLVQFSLIPLFTVGFYGPLSTIYNLFITGNFNVMLTYILNESINLANPYTAYYFTKFLFNVIKFNF
jgi:hypothetical protein